MATASLPHLQTTWAPAETTPHRAVPLRERVLGLVGAGLFAGYALLALAHLTNRYRVDFVSGVYASLAAQLNQGTFYPALYDGQAYGGTRYMPLHFVLHAGVARLTGEYLISGKLLGLAVTMALCVLIYLLLRRRGLGSGAALGLTSLVLVSESGLQAALTIRGDLLSIVFQLAALLSVQGKPRTRRTVIAAIFCLLAFLTKFSALWAPAAIASWYLLRRQWRCAGIFVAVYVTGAVVSVFALDALTGGRMRDNFAAMSVSGVDGLGLVMAPFIFLFWLKNCTLLGALVPLAGFEVALAIRRRRLNVCHLALLFCVPLLVLIYADFGAYGNHLIDLVVLVILAVGYLWRRLPAHGRVLGGLRLALAIGLVWIAGLCWSRVMFPSLRYTASVWSSRQQAHPVKPLAKHIGDHEPIIAQDAWIELSRGRCPVVLDPYSVARFAEKQPELIQGLVGRIRRGELAHIVLNHSLEDNAPVNRLPDGWQSLLFGRVVVDAMRQRYRLETIAEGYHVYAPRPVSEAHP